MKVAAFTLAALLSASAAEAPLNFYGTVREHVGEILEKGYATDLSWWDFDHGHLLFRKHEGCYDTLEQALNNVALVLYHTEENTGRWASDYHPISEKAPRSIVGRMDGSVMPAIDYPNLKLTWWPEVYPTNGTVFDMDIYRSDPGISYQKNICIGDRLLDSQFYINPGRSLEFVWSAAPIPVEEPERPAPGPPAD